MIELNKNEEFKKDDQQIHPISIAFIVLFKILALIVLVASLGISLYIPYYIIDVTGDGSYKWAYTISAIWVINLGDVITTVLKLKIT